MVDNVSDTTDDVRQKRIVQNRQGCQLLFCCRNISAGVGRIYSSKNVIYFITVCHHYILPYNIVDN